MPFANLISLYLLFVSVAVVFCAVQMRSLNGSAYTKTALLLCFAVCFYILGYTMELNSTVPANILFWNRIEYIGIPFVSALWLTTGLVYTGYYRRHKRILFAAIYLIPTVTLILRLTNHNHHLYFASVKFENKFEILFFVKQPGPWMYVQLVHSALMIFTSMGVFIWDTVKRSEKQIGKILLIILASLFAVAGLSLSMAKPFGFPIDYMALCLPVTCVMVILAIVRFDLLEMKSLARNKVFDASSDAILLINRWNKVLDCNRSARHFLEQLHIHSGSRTLGVLFSKTPDLLDALKKSEPVVVKLMLNNEERYFEITTENFDDHNVLRGWIKTIRDITRIHQLNEELMRQAATDELSVLANRRAFMNIGREWVVKSEQSHCPLYLLMLDLDHFKDINDRYGHLAGDFVIREFSQLLKNRFDSNSLVARLGGEEFAVLFQWADDEKIAQMLDIFLSSAQHHIYRYSAMDFQITVSIGMTKKQPGQTLENMMGKADKALYQSKDLGRNRFTVL